MHANGVYGGCAMRMWAPTGVALALTGCMPATADVQIENVTVLQSYEESVVTIEVANHGLLNAWIHTWPEQLRTVDNGVVIELHGENYEGKDAPDILNPLIRYQRLAPGTEPINLNEYAFQVELPPEFGDIDDRGMVTDLQFITVELAWHEQNPGSDVKLSDAPTPDGVATYTWHSN